MATAVNTVQRKVDEVNAKDQAEIIPEIIEERRRDAEGVQYVTKYQRGKLLGKVSETSLKLFQRLYCC